MKEGADIAGIASLIGDPARANILTALLSGKALTPGELAREAGITPQTASSHLAKLEAGGLTLTRRQGRHRYVTLAGSDVASVLEQLTSLAAGSGRLRTRPGPRDPDMRAARVCYNHLAGARAVQLYDSLCRRGALTVGADGITLTASGHALVEGMDIDLAALKAARAPLCRECLDWSERRTHLAGSLGRALFSSMEERGWLKRIEGSRTVRFTRAGAAAFDAAFPPPDAPAAAG
ncbi:winged helix-turn-helix domain-containing protein [Acuticoccus sp. MNP-M23]|uniref:ArsR/SmtB family transcription factor n=1 Tax=Acuticoccus sp. MNP-M23 TaxID=3072793 RepID=UPI00281565CE|nr:winged helix-turn-helix domain-containing protein [Acuticoccus sp. MNP-M23]WMS42907.1 winged helix-turn-helix domain-containing protein [Acuticoccus sp. MNP-M23]